MSHNIPILYVCFSRLEYVEVTLPLLLSLNTKIYISSEGYNTSEEQVGVNKVRSYIKNLSSENIILWERDINYGCEQNIIDSIRWITSIEEEFIMIEEDVKITNEFYQFILENRSNIDFDKYCCISRRLYGCYEGNYQFNPHGWYSKSSLFWSVFNDWIKYTKHEYIDKIVREIHKPSSGAFKAVKHTFINRPFYWDEFYKYSIYFNKAKILYCPDNIGCIHIGKISSNQHGFIWLEDGTFKRIN